MKQLRQLFTVYVLFVANAANSQTRVPEPNPEAPSSASSYYSNLGQIVDESGNLHSEILYYTEQGFPSVFLTAKGAYFVARQPGADSTAPDTLNRVTMEFKCISYPEIPCGGIATYEPGLDTLNYYLPHCSSGITGVTGYAGVVYQDVFANTDFHFYSNDEGMKDYIRFKVGSDPNDFRLKFTGQDSIVALGSIVAMYVNGMAFELPLADAYEVDAFNNVTPVSWVPTWNVVADGELGIGLGAYSSSRDLIVRIGQPKKTRTTANHNLYWATYYGTGLNDKTRNNTNPSVEETPLICANANDDVFHAMSINSTLFGSFRTTLLFSGAKDCYITKFEKNTNAAVAAIGAPIRKWATFFGGGGDDLPRAIVEGDASSSTGELYIAGSTNSGTSGTAALPAITGSPNFQRATNNGGVDGFIAQFNKASGALQYDTYFGGSGFDEITCLAPDPANHTLYFAGNTSSSTASTTCNSSSNFPLCAGSGTRYFQNTISQSSQDGFVASLNTNNKGLTWSTYFGAYHDDEIWSIAISTVNNNQSIFIGGWTNSGASTNSNDWSSPKIGPIIVPGTPPATQFPITDPGGGAYFQNVGAVGSNEDGFLARFDGNYQLAWCSYFGGSSAEIVTKVGANAAGELYATGVTVTDNENPNFTTVNTANTNGDFPTFQPNSTAYHQSFQGTGAGGINPTPNAFIARFDASQILSWCTYFGGTGGAFKVGSPQSLICDHAISPNGDVYMSGFSTLDNTASSGSNIPICSTCSPSTNYNQLQNASTGRTTDQDPFDGWLVQFNSSNAPVWITNYGGIVTNQNGFTPWITGAGKDPNADERINAIALGGSGNNVTLYMTGTTRCDNTPVEDFDKISGADYFQPKYSGDGDVFIGRFYGTSTTVGINSSPVVYYGGHNLVVSPNPSAGIFDVKYYPSLNVAEANVKVLNELGQVVNNMTSPIQGRQAKFTLDLRSVPSGFYILNVNGESKMLIKK